MRTPSITLLLASSVLLSLAACGDDPSIVATWRELPNAFEEEPTPEAERATWTFGDDGNLTMVEDGETSTSPYTLDGDRLTVTITEPDETLVITTPIVLTDDRLMIGALFADGDVDGAVGQWRGSSTLDERMIDSQMTLAADRSARFSQQVTGEDATVFENGTWMQDGDSLLVRFPVGEGSTISFRSRLIEGVAIGNALMERI